MEGGAKQNLRIVTHHVHNCNFKWLQLMERKSVHSPKGPCLCRRVSINTCDILGVD